MTKTKAAKARAKAAKKEVVKAVVKAAAKAKPVGISGHGDYRPSPFRKLGGHGDYRSTLGGVGGAIGSGLGGAVGSVADGLSGIFKAITGSGDYRTKGPKKNSLWNAATFPMKMGAANAQFNGGPPRIQHREFVMPVIATGSSAFSTTPFRIQPGVRGIGSLFPWLSQVAQNFQQYRAHGIIFEFVSMSSEFSTQVGLGEISMATQYNAGNLPLATQTEVNNNEFTTIDKPSNSFIHPIELASSQSSTDIKYIRSTNSAAKFSDGGSSEDERLDDVGVFQISMNGIPTSVAAGTELGELWVMYDIELLKPIMPDIHVGTTFFASHWGYTSGGTPYAPGNGAFLDPRNSLPMVPNTGNVPTRIAMPPGYAGAFLFILVSGSTAGAVVTGPGSLTLTGPGLTPLALMPNSWNSTTNKPAPTTLTISSNTSIAIAMYTFTYDGSGVAGANFISAAPCTFSAGTGWCSTLVLPIDSDFSTGSLLGSLAPILARMGLKRNVADLLDSVLLQQAVPTQQPLVVYTTESSPSALPPMQLPASSSAKQIAWGRSSLPLSPPQPSPPSAPIAEQQQAGDPDTRRNSVLSDGEVLDLGHLDASSLPSEPQRARRTIDDAIRDLQDAWSGAPDSSAANQALSALARLASGK